MIKNNSYGKQFIWLTRLVNITFSALVHWNLTYYIDHFVEQGLGSNWKYASKILFAEYLPLVLKLPFAFYIQDFFLKWMKTS